MNELTLPDGRILRMGSLPKPTGFKTCFSPFASAGFEPMSRGDMISIVSHPSRTKRRDIFGPEWKLNQHEFGACNGFSAAGGYGKTRFLRGIQDKMLFSGAWLYSLMNRGRDHGSALEDGMKKIVEVGCAPLSLVPYDQIYPHLQTKREAALAAAAQHRGCNIVAIETIEDLNNALVRGFMCIVAVHVGPQNNCNFMRLDANGVSGLDHGIGNHSILIQDIKWDGQSFLYDHDGSWGLSLLDKGNSWLREWHFKETIKNHQFYAIVSTTESTL